MGPMYIEATYILAIFLLQKLSRYKIDIVFDTFKLIIYWIETSVTTRK